MRFSSKLTVSILVAVVVLILLLVLFFRSGNDVYSKDSAIFSTEHQEFIIATGNVSARDDVSLSFEHPGRVSQVFFEAGDAVQRGALIAQLDTQSLRSEIESQRFRLEQEVLQLDSFVEGPEQIERERVQAEKFVSQQRLENALNSAIFEVQHISVALENSIRKDFDVYFDGVPGSFRFTGEADVATRPQFVRVREELEKVFLKWRSSLDTYSSRLVRVRSDTLVINTLNDFLTDLYLLQKHSTGLYDLVVKNRNSMAGAEELFLLLADVRSVVQQHIVAVGERRSAVFASKAEFTLAEAQLNEVLAGGTNFDQDKQSAQVQREQEALRLLELRLTEAEVRAPFTGVVGTTLVKRGEYVGVGEEVVRFISSGGFEVMADVSEAEIEDVALGAELLASVEALARDITLRVRTINSTETKIGDVPVYSVVFDVVEDDVSLRSGMTVDVRIPFGEVQEVLAVPRDAVIQKGKGNIVVVMRGSDMVEVPVDLGSVIDTENVIIQGDISSGEQVLFNISEK